MSIPDYPDYQTPFAHADAMKFAQRGVTTEIAALVATGTAGGTPGGVPLLHGQSSVVLDSSILLAAGASKTYTVAVANIGWELNFEPQQSGAGVMAQAEVSIQWIDSGSGETLKRVRACAWPCSSSGTNDSTFNGSGPTAGNQAKIIVTNHGSTANLVYNILFTQSGRVYPRDRFFPRFFNSTASGRTVPSNDCPAGVLASKFTAAQGIGVTVTIQLPMFMGKARLHADTASNTTDLAIIIQAIDDPSSTLDTGIVYSRNSDSTGNINDDVWLPGVQCYATITNNNAAAKNTRFVLVSSDY